MTSLPPGPLPSRGGRPRTRWQWCPDGSPAICTRPDSTSSCPRPWSPPPSTGCSTTPTYARPPASRSGSPGPSPTPTPPPRRHPVNGRRSPAPWLPQPLPRPAPEPSAPAPTPSPSASTAAPTNPPCARPATPLSLNLRACRGVSRIRRPRDPQRVRPHLVPLLQQKTVRIEEAPNLRCVPTHNLLQHRDQHAQRVLAQNRAPRNRRQVAVLRHRNRQPVQPVHVQHHVDVGASVPHVHNPVVADGQPLPQFFQHHHFPVTRRHPHDRVDLARRLVVTKARPKNAVRRDDPFERRLDHFFRRRRHYVQREVPSVQIAQQRR